MQIAPLSAVLAIAMGVAQDPTPDVAEAASAPARDYAGPAAIEAPEAPEQPVPPPERTAPEVVPDPAPADDAALEEGYDALDDDDDELFDDEDAFVADGYDPLRDSPEALKARGWVRSGIVFTVVGGVLAIGGTIMGLTDPCDLSAGNGCQELARDRAAQAMAIPGAAMLAGGIAMLVVGKRQEKRLRASYQALRSGGGLRLTLSF